MQGNWPKPLPCEIMTDRLVAEHEAHQSYIYECPRCRDETLVKFDGRMPRKLPTVPGNKKFGRLTVLRLFKSGNVRKDTLAECVCDCGVRKIIKLHTLRRKQGVRSCGCLVKIVLTKHGYAPWKGKRSREYITWRSMIDRCERVGNKSWPLYGGRGIKVCARWREDFNNFLLDMGKPHQGKTLDRYPNRDGNYEPENCRWATPAEQSRNTSRNHYFTKDNQTLCVADWATKLNIPRTTLYSRYKNTGTIF